MKNFCQKCGGSFEGPRGKLFCDSCLLEEQKELKAKTEEEKINQSLGEEHFKLVQQLKQNLIMGQLGFLQAGKVLHEIKEKKTYRAEDFSREITWEEFLMRPDLPFPTSSRNPESIRRMANRLIDVYQTFVEKLKYKEEELASIGFSKLNLIAPVVRDLDKADNVVPQWIEKARGLTVKDLIAEIRTKDKTLGELLECQHINAYEIKMFYCPDCARYFKSDPRLKEK